MRETRCRYAGAMSEISGHDSSSNLSSLRPSSPEEALQGVELHFVLSLIGNFALLSSHVAFFSCMWKLGNGLVYCVTMYKAYSAAKRSNWVTLNVSMFSFEILLLINLFWFYLVTLNKISSCEMKFSSLKENMTSSPERNYNSFWQGDNFLIRRWKFWA